MTRPTHALELLDTVLDPGSIESWDGPVDLDRLRIGSGPTADYRQQLRAAAERAGVDESVITGRGLVRGRAVVFLVNEFSFLAGSIGQVAADRIVTAVHRATAEGMPVLASACSGGTRMQEDASTFARMSAIAQALAEHRRAGLPYLVHLRNPTTGGVLASWGSLGHITVAEPGALVGFLGPKVFEGLTGGAFPSGVQVAENLADEGVIDAVVATDRLPDLVDRALAALMDPPTPRTAPAGPADVDPLELTEPVWASITRTRRADRPGITDLLRHGGRSTLRLQGTGHGERGTGMVVALTRLLGRPCVVVGHDRLRQAVHPLGPADLREAQRGMVLAQELGLPLVTVVDTPGADLSPAAEEGGLAGELARSIAMLTTLTVPSVSVLLGQGCGGAALALLPARTVIAAERSWLSPLPLEGASIILYGDPDHAAELATAQRVRADQLLADGVVHHVVREPDDPTGLVRAVLDEVASALAATG